MALSARHRVAAAALGATLAFGSLALGGTSYQPPAGDPEAVRLHKLDTVSKTSFVDPTTKFRWGRAQIFVYAPVKQVRSAIMDYGNWSLYIQKFQKTKVLKKEPTGAAEVFLQLPILKGAATIWAVEQFTAPVPDGKGEKILGALLKGNIDALHAVWRYRPVDDTHSVVSLELYTATKVVAPADLVLSETMDACGEAVFGVRARAEAKK